MNSLRRHPTLSRWLARLPGSSTYFGPPRRIATASDCARSGRCIIREAVPLREQPAPNVLFFGLPPPPFIAAPLPHVPPVFIGDMPGGRLLWPDNSIVTADDTLVQDTSFWALCDQGRLGRHPLGLRWQAPPRRRLRGRVLCISSDLANSSFGHFVLDALPRLEYLHRASRDLGEFDVIVLPALSSPTLDYLCAAALPPATRILRLGPREDLVCDHLTFVTFPGWPGNYPPETPAFYRRILGLPSSPGSRRIYLSRQKQKRRRVRNAPEIEAVLAWHGFETVFPETDPDTIRKCSEAAIIVGVEGSNLVNQVFAPPGGSIILLVDEKWRDLPYVCSLAAACGNRLLAVVGEACNIPDDAGLRWTNPQDLILPPEALEAAILTALA